MFEALLSPLLLRVLGQYIEDLPREQLRVALWSGVVRLENVRLRPDAFNHLKVPFAVRQGTIALLELKVRGSGHTSAPSHSITHRAPSDGAHHFIFYFLVGVCYFSVSFFLCLSQPFSFFFRARDD